MATVLTVTMLPSVTTELTFPLLHSVFLFGPSSLDWVTRTMVVQLLAWSNPLPVMVPGLMATFVLLNILTILVSCLPEE